MNRWSKGWKFTRDAIFCWTLSSGISVPSTQCLCVKWAFIEAEYKLSSIKVMLMLETIWQLTSEILKHLRMTLCVTLEFTLIIYFSTSNKIQCTRKQE